MGWNKVVSSGPTGSLIDVVLRRRAKTALRVQDPSTLRTASPLIASFRSESLLRTSTPKPMSMEFRRNSVVHVACLVLHFDCGTARRSGAGGRVASDRREPPRRAALRSSTHRHLSRAKARKRPARARASRAARRRRVVWGRYREMYHVLIVIQDGHLTTKSLCACACSRPGGGRKT